MQSEQEIEPQDATYLPSQEVDEGQELDRWRALGARLWPFVRYFGLCGGCPESIEAVGDLATLLGEDCLSATVMEAMDRARREQTASVLAKLPAILAGRCKRSDVEVICKALGES
jgi:hypothetical protein